MELWCKVHKHQWITNSKSCLRLSSKLLLSSKTPTIYSRCFKLVCSNRTQWPEEWIWWQEDLCHHSSSSKPASDLRFSNNNSNSKFNSQDTDCLLCLNRAAILNSSNRTQPWELLWMDSPQATITLKWWLELDPHYREKEPMAASLDLSSKFSLKTNPAPSWNILGQR